MIMVCTEYVTSVNHYSQPVKPMISQHWLNQLMIDETVQLSLSEYFDKYFSLVDEATLTDRAEAFRFQQ